MKEVANFIGRIGARSMDKSNAHARKQLTHAALSDYKCYCYMMESDMVIVTIADHEYPRVHIFKMQETIWNEFKRTVSPHIYRSVSPNLHYFFNLPMHVCAGKIGNIQKLLSEIGRVHNLLSASTQQQYIVWTFKEIFAR